MPVDIVDVTTGDPSTGYRVLNETFVADRPASVFRPAVPTSFELRLRSATAEGLGADTLRIAADISLSGQPMTEFAATTLVAGQVSFEAGAESLQARRGDVWVVPTTAGHEAGWREMTVAMLRVPMASVVHAAAAEAGHDVPAFAFRSIRPVSTGAARQWQHLNAYVHRLFVADDEPPLEHALVRSRTVGLVAATALAVFPSTVTAPAYEPEPGPALPAVLRRAVAHIEAHAHEPLTVVDIAEAARVTPRALQLAFRRRYDETPMGYLRRVRLGHAHEDLRRAESGHGETVTQVAHRWGWSSPSSFSLAYRQAYGRTPGETLRE